MRKRIFFRADGDSKMGLGHVIRSLALAEMLKDKYDCLFIIRCPIQTLKNQILEVCETIVILKDTNETIDEAELIADKYITQSDIVVLDGYHFDINYQKTIQQKGCKLVCIDDIQHTAFSADAVINHAPGLNATAFSINPHTLLLLGSEYALLRSPFLRAASLKRNIVEINTVFVCFGGADFNNLSLKILKLFSRFQGKKYNINMVLGGANDFKEKVRDFALTITDFNVNLYENLNADQMANVMQQSDCAIVPASSVMYEVLAIKMPVIGGYYVDNQINIYNGFNRSGLIQGIGDLNKFVDYESVLNILSRKKIVSILKKQEEVGIANAKNNHIQLFNLLASKL